VYSYTPNEGGWDVIREDGTVRGKGKEKKRRTEKKSRTNN